MDDSNEPDFLSLMVVVAMALAPLVASAACIYYSVAAIINGSWWWGGLAIGGVIAALCLYLGIRGAKTVIGIAKAFPSTRSKMLVGSVATIVALYVRIFHWK